MHVIGAGPLRVTRTPYKGQPLTNEVGLLAIRANLIGITTGDLISTKVRGHSSMRRLTNVPILLVVLKKYDKALMTNKN